MPTRMRRAAAAGRPAAALRLDTLPAEVLQACATTLIGTDYAATKALALLAVCRATGEALKHTVWATLCPHLAAKLWRTMGCPGTPDEDSAWRWIKAHGAAVKRMIGVTVDDQTLERLSTLQLALPALECASGLTLVARPGAAPAATQAIFTSAVRAVARCPRLHTLGLLFELLPHLGSQLPEALGRKLARARALGTIALWVMSHAEERGRPYAASVAPLVSGLAGLSRLRKLSLRVDLMRMGGALPACLSCLAGLISLELHGLHGLRCAPGWARLPALVDLRFGECPFVGNGEAALPGMDALVSLTSLCVWECPGLRALPASLWRLAQLRSITHWLHPPELASVPRGEQPAAGLPAAAPCFAALTCLNLGCLLLRAFPAGKLAMTRLKNLNMYDSCCFEQLPVSVSMLTALEELTLGRPAAHNMQLGGTLDVRALGSLACCPRLRSLHFFNCSLLFCASFQAVAAHPRLQELTLETAYPASGPSCRAFLAFVSALLQQGRADVLVLVYSVVEGAGRLQARDFRGALRGMGFPLGEQDLADLA